jgi:hypothetical protein
MSQPIPKMLAGDIEITNSFVESTAQVKGSFYELMPGVTSGKVAAATALFGMKWTDIRRMFVNVFDRMFGNKQNQRIIREVIMKNTWRKFPVRTGHLFDYIFRFMEMSNTHFYNTRHMLRFYNRWPIDRPWPIKGNVNHTWPNTGHGKMPIPPPILLPPNAKLIAQGPKGGLLFSLNDPQAVNDPIPYVHGAAIQEGRMQLRNLFTGLRIKLTMQVKNQTGAVSVVGGSQTNIKP